MSHKTAQTVTVLSTAVLLVLRKMVLVVELVVVKVVVVVGDDLLRNHQVEVGGNQGQHRRKSPAKVVVGKVKGDQRNKMVVKEETGIAAAVETASKRRMVEGQRKERKEEKENPVGALVALWRAVSRLVLGNLVQEFSVPVSNLAIRGVLDSYHTSQIVKIH